MRVLLAMGAFLLLTEVSECLAEQVSQFSARHVAGQTFLTWTEVEPVVAPASMSIPEVKKLQARLEAEKQLRYRIYRAIKPITAISGLTPLAEVLPLTGWNTEYYGIYPKPHHQAARYVIGDGEEPLAPGAGFYVFNPPKSGHAYYAITAVVNGKENVDISHTNSLQHPIQEDLGQGVPVLQRIERPESFQYIKQPTLHYYVRWESPPNSSVPGRPFDYLVAIPPHLARPAPVGLHLHAWGSNLSGGYGWCIGTTLAAQCAAKREPPAPNLPVSDVAGYSYG